MSSYNQAQRHQQPPRLYFTATLCQDAHADWYLFVCMCTQTSSVPRDTRKNCMFRPLNNTAGLMTLLPHKLVYTMLPYPVPPKALVIYTQKPAPRRDLPPALAPINLQSDRAQPWLTAQQHTSPCLPCPHLTTSHAHTTKPCHQAVHAGSHQHTFTCEQVLFTRSTAAPSQGLPSQATARQPSASCTYC